MKNYQNKSGQKQVFFFFQNTISLLDSMSKFGLGMQPYLQLLQLFRNILRMLIWCVCVCILVCMCLCVHWHSSVSCWYLIQSFESVKMLTTTEHYHSRVQFPAHWSSVMPHWGKTDWNISSFSGYSFVCRPDFFNSKVGFCLFVFTFSGNNSPFHESCCIPCLEVGQWCRLRILCWSGLMCNHQKIKSK